MARGPMSRSYVVCGKRGVPLSLLQERLLRRLAEGPGPVDRWTLYQLLWPGVEEAVARGRLDVLLCEFRRKAPDVIVTHWGAGWSLAHGTRLGVYGQG